MATTQAQPGRANPGLSQALAAIDTDPISDAGWDRLEALADELQAPDEVLQAYREALTKGLSKSDAPRIADRAVKFCQAWFIDTPEAMPELLGLIVDRYPELDWAFERLVVWLTQSSKWDELLSLYDHALGATRDEKKRRKLLEDAAGLAKDFADQPDRAADYLQQLLRLEPDNDKLVTQLERLLERRERYDDLLALWRDQIPKMSTDDARATRAKIAAISLEKLHAPERAVSQLRDLVEESPGHDEACRQLERILAQDDAPPATRREALSLLRTTYEIVERADDVVRVLEQALGFVSGEDGRALRRDLGNRLAIQGRDADALAHFAVLLRESPSDTDARRQLRQLSKRAERFDLLAGALLEAADACDDISAKVSLWVEAADVRRLRLGDGDGAIALYRRVLDAEEADEADARRAAHKLSELLSLTGRGEERLPVLERLSQLERSPSFRRQILGEAARLAEQLGSDDRALASWRQVLEADPGDLEALGATIRLLDRGQRWDELVEALRARASAPVSEAQQRADLVRVAQVQHGGLSDPHGAIATWRDISERFGEDSEVVSALDGLLEETEQWDELGRLLDGATTRERNEAAQHLVRLADLFRTELDRPAEALPLYQQALELDPRDARARAGASALVEVPSTARGAAEALWRAYQRCDEWSAQLELCAPRLATLSDRAEQAGLLAQVARIHEVRAQDGKQALRALCRAVPLDPRRRDLRSELLRLAEAENGWFDAATALREAASAFPDDPSSAAELRRREAQILEQHLDDHAAAYEAYAAAGALVPDDVVALSNAARTAALAGLWAPAAQAAVATAIALGRVDPKVMEAFERAAERIDAWSEACEALSDAIAGRAADLPPETASRLHGRVAEWHRDRTGDAESAKLEAQRAIALTPDDVQALERLVTLQRSAPGPELADTLLRIDAVGDERSLDALREACQVTLDADPARALKVLERLYRKSSDLWLAGESASGSHDAVDTAAWAAEELVERLLAAGEKDRAVRVLLHAGELPFDPPKRAALAVRAAELLSAQNERLRAIDAYRRAVSLTPNDLDTIRKLAALTEREEQASGAVALRERELSLTSDKAERLALRLANAERAASIESRSGRVESLLANLDEAPGHPPTIDALQKLLEGRGQHATLADVLAAQADALEQAGEAEAAAALFGRLADIAEKNLHDPTRALEAHKRVVALADSPRSLDALARLSSAQEQYAEAARWLEKRLASAQPTERVAVLIKLARTHLKASREGEAISVLTTAFAEAPQSAEVRKLLIPLLRQRGDWAALAKTLAASVEHAADEATVLAYAREAAELFNTVLDTPDAAVPVLRRAVELAPDDKRLRSMLGEGLRVAGELDEARELLAQLVADYGRRGSPERAAAHTLLAKVLHAQGEHAEALAQLEVATKMAPDDVTILRTVAQLAREAGQLERAEAALRTLLLTARRLQADGSTAPIGTSEVFFELSSLASARGQAEQAEELAQSAIEALSENDSRAPQLQRKLRAQGERTLLLRLLDARLSYVTSPYRRGQILAERAEILAELERPEDALEARLCAIDADPGSPLVHEGARELAAALGQLDRYVAHLEGVLSRARRDTDAMIRCEVLLRLGAVYEREQQDYDKASEAYDQAEATGVREVDVLRARARVAGARGDEEEQIRILEHLASLGEDQVETRADALYRIAEVQLAAEDSLEHGVESLRKALADFPKPERACMVLRRATEQHPQHEGLLDAYEQVARDSGDDTMLLHYLERRAMHDKATTDHVREAVTKALALDQGERAEALMQRAVDLAREGSDGLFAVDWALLGLAERASLRGDVEAAVRWLELAGEVAEPEPLFELSRKVAAIAGEGNDADPRLAAKLYERLRERDPTARDAWEPLVEIYARLGEVEALERVVRETLDGLQDVEDRNALRVGLAKALLSDASRVDDAIQVLREALFDQPGHPAALELLSGSLERGGKTDELVELLRDQLMGAQDRRDVGVIKATSLKLGQLVPQDDAIAIYRDALGYGDDEELLGLLLSLLGPDHDPGERALLGERLLALLRGSEAARLARSVASLYAELNDSSGQLRALEMGLERSPGDAGIREELERYYREQGDHGGLARVLVATAEASDDPERKLSLLREAAVVYREQLSDPSGAIELLERARALAPDDLGLCVDLASSMADAGSAERAIELLTQAIDQTDGDARLSLLRARSQARAAGGDPEGALGDIEAAYELDAMAVADELVALLEERRIAAAEAADADQERAITMRCIDIMTLQERRDEALGLLMAWTERKPDDVDALCQLRDLEAQDQRWEDLERTCLQLIDLQQGDDQVASAAMLLEACVQLGTPQHAREPLERVWGGQPDNPAIRTEVRRLYELVGAHQELARMLLEEARTMDDEEDKVAYLRWAGEALLASGDVGSAMPALTEVLELRPDDAQARCLLADANVLLGRFSEAHALLDEVIARTKRSAPELSMYHHRKAYVASAEGDHAAQLESLKRAHQAARKHGPIAAELADLAEALEQWELAVATLRTITTLEDCPISPAVALVRQGRIALRQGDEKRARLCARRAAMTDAEADGVQALLAELGETV